MNAQRENEATGEHVSASAPAASYHRRLLKMMPANPACSGSEKLSWLAFAAIHGREKICLTTSAMQATDHQ